MAKPIPITRLKQEKKKALRELVHRLQGACRRRLETSRWSQGVALRNRIIEGARPAQLKAGAKLLAQRALKIQRLRAAAA